MFFVLLPLSRESEPDLLILNPRNRKNPRHLMDQIVVLMSSPAKPEAEAGKGDKGSNVRLADDDKESYRWLPDNGYPVSLYFLNIS